MWLFLRRTGGTDKGEFGFRKDSKTIIDALKKRGWNTEIIFYDDSNRGEIYRHTLKQADAYMEWVNPGNLGSEIGYFQMLRELVARHQGATTPRCHDILWCEKCHWEFQLSTHLVPADVYTYYDFDTLESSYPKR